jgi:hypothetical protein
MANRTLQFFGSAYGSEPVTVTASFNGVEIFNDTLPTINGPVNTTDPWNDSFVMFTADINSSTLTNIPLEFVVSGNATAVVGRIEGNYMYEPNSIYSTEDYAILMNTSSSPTLVAETMDKYAVPPFTPSEMALVESTNPGDTTARRELLYSKGLQPYIPTGPDVFSSVCTSESCYANIVINGTAVTSTDPRAIPHLNPVTGVPDATISWELVGGSDFVCDVDLAILQGIPPHLLEQINASML